MNDNAAEGSIGISRLAYLGVFLWSLVGAYLAVWFNPRIALPFIALTGAMMLVIPFDVAFFGTLIFGLIHDPSINNPFQIYVGGFNLWLLEICFFLVFVIMFVEVITKRIKLSVSPMFFVLGIFLLSTVLQTARGYTLGYNIGDLRGNLRNALYPILIFPIGFYFGSGGSVKKFVKVLLIAWGIALIMYLMMYYGFLTLITVSLSGRLAWPTAQNILLFVPMLIFLLVDKNSKTRDSLIYWVLLLFSIVVILATQSRSNWAALTCEMTLILFILMIIKPRGEKLKFILKILIGLLAAGVIGIIVLKFIKGDGYDVFIKSVTDRAFSLFEWRKDIAIASRRYQIYESLKLVQRNWLFGRGVGVEWFSLAPWGLSRIDGVFFLILGQQGLVGLALFLSIYALWMQRSIYIVLHHKEIDDPLVQAFALAQPVYILAVLVNGVASSMAYVLPTNTILIYSSAMITEKIYHDLKITERSKKEIKT